MNQIRPFSFHALRLGIAVLVTVSIVSLAAIQAMAQSSKRTPPSGQAGSGTPAAGSADRSSNARSVGLEGYCPVCILELKEWVKGSPQITAQYDGKTYYFPGRKQRDMFLQSPEKYVPALGGDCVVCYANAGDRVPGSVQHAALSNNRLFLFPNEELQQEFIANPSKYTNQDLALEGQCSVCRVEMNKDVPGKPEISALHEGFRYLFPSEDQKKMFLDNPQKYEVK